jgi:hypothetical protein
MKKRHLKWLSVCVAYAALWALTLHFGPAVLRRQTEQEARAEWEHSRASEVALKQKSPDATLERITFANGPRTDVRLRFSPAPLVIVAESAKGIGPMHGYGTVGWYFVTPWRAYKVHVQFTWMT